MEQVRRPVMTGARKDGRLYVEDTESFDARADADVRGVRSGFMDESFTILLDDVDDPDAPTLVFATEPTLTLERLGTGDRLCLEVPAIVGRGTKASVRVSGNRGISRQHACISRGEDGGYLLEDNGSSNGTFLGEERLEPHVPVPLVDGVTLRLADEEFVFHIG